MSVLIDFVRAREELRKNKEAGLSAPWSLDPILNKYRFTNVRRSDDRVSKWLIENVLLEKYIEKDLDSFLLFSALCRWVNWPPTIKGLMDAGFYPSKQLDFKGIGRFIDKRVKSGEKAWTGAYLIRAKPGNNKGKGHFVAVEVIQPLTKVLIPLKVALKTNSRRATWAVLEGVLNWGPFMAGQVVDDLSWTSLLIDAHDVNTWAPQGPGSLKGFNRLLGLPLKTRHKEEVWCTQLQQWRGEIIDQLGPEYEDLTLMSTQNVLCEISKYCKVKDGTGRPRSLYKPETAF